MQFDKPNTLRETFNLTIVVLEISILVISLLVPGIIGLITSTTDGGEGSTDKFIAFTITCFSVFIFSLDGLFDLASMDTTSRSPYATTHKTRRTAIVCTIAIMPASMIFPIFFLATGGLQILAIFFSIILGFLMVPRVIMQGQALFLAMDYGMQKPFPSMTNFVNASKKVCNEKK